MAVAGRSGEADVASSVAATLCEAPFVRLLSGADGDSLAATGLLARTLADRGTPFQASVVREGGTPPASDDTTTVTVGHEGPADVALSSVRPVSETAFEACRELGADPNPVLALAGAFAVGEIEGSAAFETARERELVERRPGIAVPTTDLVDGLAHTTLAHASFSGDPEATEALLDGREFDHHDGRRQVASLLALSVVSDEASTPRAANVVERALRPYVIVHPDDDSTADVPFETIGGYADVLRACAHERPGTGLALALGHDACEAALTAWRAHATRAHAALRNATTERHRNVFVARVDADASLTTTARLLRDFRSPEPLALVVTETAAAAAATDDTDLGTLLSEAATAAGGEGEGGERRAQARFEDADAFVTAFREAAG